MSSAPSRRSCAIPAADSVHEPRLKRPFDLLVSVIGMVVLSPLFGAIAAAISPSSGLSTASASPDTSTSNGRL